jgi:hypothetical protein
LSAAPEGESLDAMTTERHLPLRTSIATGLVALALLGGAFGLAKSASAAAPPQAPDRGALVVERHVSHVDVAGIRDNLEMLGVEEGEVRRPVDHQRLVVRSVGR